MTTPVPTMRPDELGELDEPRNDAPSELRTEEGALPLVALDVDGHISGLAARVRVRQTFENRLERAIEATYLHPLPDRAAVTRFRMSVADRVVDGTLMERAAARAGYEEAIAQGHRAAIAEENRPDTFAMRVGNIGPGETAVVELDLEWLLPVDETEATFRFPLVTAPRYVPGSPLEGPNVGGGTADDTDAVPDASTISPPVLLPGSTNPVRLTIGVTIDPAGLGLRDLRAALHDVVTTDEGGTSRVRVELRPGKRVDRDFVLRFGLGRDAITTAVVCTPDAEASTAGVDHPDAGTGTCGADDRDTNDRDTGTWYATVVPPETTGSGPRDVALVLDRSGSMQGWKMVAARRAAARIVDSLRSTDRFTVVAFDHAYETPTDHDGLVAATDRNRYAAVEFLSRLDARGGTEILPALTRAIAPLGESGDRDAIVVVVTDGQVGNEDQVLAGLDPKLGAVRLFTVGIDRAVNAGFLRRLAAAGAGRCELVESEDRLDEVMTSLHRRIARPVLRDVTVRRSDLGDGNLDAIADETTPRHADCFEGVPLVVAGRYRGRPPASVTLHATDELGAPWTAEVPCRIDERAGHAVWARARVRDLEDRHAVRADAGLAEQIVATSVRFGVLSRFTAYLAVDATERTASTDPARIVQPVELPSGWEVASMAPPSPPAQTFLAAVPAAAPQAAGDAFFPFASPEPPPAARTILRLEAGGPLGRALLRRPAREAVGDGGDDETVRDEPAARHEDRYRGRIDEELAALRSAIEHADRDGARRALGRLQLLVDDLSSVEAPAELVDRLRAVVDAATAWAAAPADDGRAALEAIDAFGDPGARRTRPGGDRRRAFWR